MIDVAAVIFALGLLMFMPSGVSVDPAGTIGSHPCRCFRRGLPILATYTQKFMTRIWAISSSLFPPYYVRSQIGAVDG